MSEVTVNINVFSQDLAIDQTGSYRLVTVKTRNGIQELITQNVAPIIKSFFGLSFQISFHHCQIRAHSPTDTQFHTKTRLKIRNVPSKVNIIRMCYTCLFHTATTVFDRYTSIHMKVQGTVHSQGICLHIPRRGDVCFGTHGGMFYRK